MIYYNAKFQWHVLHGSISWTQELGHAQYRLVLNLNPDGKRLRIARSNTNYEASHPDLMNWQFV